MQRKSRGFANFGGGWNRIPLIAFLAVVSASVSECNAAPAQSERLTYSVMVGGLHVGDALIALDRTDSGYSTEMKMVARGVARWLQNFRAELKSEGGFVRAPSVAGHPDLTPLPAAFVRQWSAGEMAADMTMTFDPQTHEAVTQERLFNPVTGAPLKREDMPWANRGEKPKPVPADLRKNVLDPMAAFVAARDQIMAQGVATSGPKTFRVPIYDGTRRYDVVGKTSAVRMVNINGTSRLLMPLIAKIDPIFGFTRESEERMKDSEGKFLFTPDERFIPVQLIVGNDMFTSVMNLTADCSENAGPCETFGQDTATD